MPLWKAVAMIFALSSLTGLGVFMGITLLFPVVYFVVQHLIGVNLDSAANEIWRFALLPLCALSVMLAQVLNWHEMRTELSTQSNTVILIIFAAYGAAVFGLLRFALEDFAPASYGVGTELRKTLQEREQNQLTTAIADSTADQKLLQAALDEISVPSCVPIYVVSWHDHIGLDVSTELAKRRKVAGQPTSGCRVLILRQSGTPQMAVDTNFRHLDSVPDTFIFFLQNGDVVTEHRLFLKFNDTEVAWIPGIHDVDGPGSLRRSLGEVYADPRNVNRFLSLIGSRLVWESQARKSLDQKLDRLRDANAEVPIPFSEFMIITVGQFFETFEDMIIPATLRAQILDLLFHVLRFLFAVVYLESLARTRDQPAA